MKLNINNSNSKYANNLAFNSQYYSRHAKGLTISEGIQIKKGFFNKCFYAVLIVIKKLTK